MIHKWELLFTEGSGLDPDRLRVNLRSWLRSGQGCGLVVWEQRFVPAFTKAWKEPLSPTVDRRRIQTGPLMAFIGTLVFLYFSRNFIASLCLHCCYRGHRFATWDWIVFPNVFYYGLQRLCVNAVGRGLISMLLVLFEMHYRKNSWKDYKWMYWQWLFSCTVSGLVV